MRGLRTLFLTPAALTMMVLFLAPLSIVVAYSLLNRGAYGGVILPWTGENYARVVSPIYGDILWRSFWIAGIATILCLVLGFPLALFISRSGSKRTLLLNLVMLPFWT